MAICVPVGGRPALDHFLLLCHGGVGHAAGLEIVEAVGQDHVFEKFTRQPFFT